MAEPLSIVITGPECSGKSSLCAALAERLNEPWVPEYAVQYLENLDSDYYSEDLVAIATGQLRHVAAAKTKARNFLIIDTGVEVVDVWHRDKIGPLPQPLLVMRQNWHPDLYLLCKPDIPYEPHPLREDGHRRDELFEMYKEMLRDEPTALISGPFEDRVNFAIQAIEQLRNP